MIATRWRAVISLMTLMTSLMTAMMTMMMMMRAALVLHLMV